MVELLSPAGDMDALQMAVQNGADAVYFGGTLFNARQYATNFSTDEIERAFDYCHERNVKAYITLNTLLNDDEILQAFDFAVKTANLGADALILQDIGLIDLLSRYTDIPLHASTQMSLHNSEGIKLLTDNTRISRVILARETPIEDIKAIKASTEAELEVFIHGALCISFSGQCLMSSLTGGRSGNRGVCAQICRLPFKLEKDGEVVNSGYLISPKDLCTIDHLQELVNSGVSSLKIEGRMKRPEYVGIVTKQYRLALDAINSGAAFDSQAGMKELLSIFNRGGFTKGYYFNSQDIIFTQRPSNNGIFAGTVVKELPKNRIEVNTQINLNVGDTVQLRQNGQELGGGTVEYIIQNDNRLNSAKGKLVINSVISMPCKGAQIYKMADKAQLQEINQVINKERPREALDFNLAISENTLRLKAFDRVGNVAEQVLSFEGDYNNFTADEAIQKALSKLGNTPFWAGEITIERYSQQYIPLRYLNEIRRMAVEEILNQKRIRAKNRYTAKTPQTPVQDISNTGKKRVCVEVDDLTWLQGNKNPEIDCVYYRPQVYNTAAFETLRRINANQGLKVYIAIPNITFEDDINHLYTLLSKFKIDYYGIIADGLAGVALALKLQKPLVTDIGLNVLNKYSARFFTGKFGAEYVSPSVELNERQIYELAKYAKCELILYGRIRLMSLVACPKKADGKGTCAGCEGNWRLIDRKNYRFPLKTVRIKNCINYIYNSKTTSLVRNLSSLEKSYLGSYRIIPDGQVPINFSLGSINESELKDITQGHFNRGV